MNGRTHVFYGVGLVTLIFLFLIWFAYDNPIYDYPSLLAFAVGGSFGAFFPDFDLFLGIEKHRWTLTHSSILPLGVTISYAFTPDPFARTLLMFICFGMATHMAFDLFISSPPKKYQVNLMSRWGWRLAMFFTGKVGGSFKGSGSDWANRHKRAYLIFHTIVCIACGAILLWGILNGIDIDGWWLT